MSIENLNMDFSQTVVIDTAKQPWLPSPLAGVERIPLARAQAEQGHATSLVRYQKNASFHAHTHFRGEEILVLEGVFSDESGDYPAGSYLRNPPGSRHRPFSQPGCTLFVKLQQFQVSDKQQLALNSRDLLAAAAGQRVLLHRHKDEQVELVSLAAGSRLSLNASGATHEMFIVSGALEHSGRHLGTYAWLRSAAAIEVSGTADSVLWLRSWT